MNMAEMVEICVLSKLPKMCLLAHLANSEIGYLVQIMQTHASSWMLPLLLKVFVNFMPKKHHHFLCRKQP